jgi:hypothetical protein
VTAKSRRPPWTRLEAALVAFLGVLYASVVVLFSPAYIDLARLSAPVYAAFQGVSPLSLLLKPQVPRALLAMLVWYRFCLPGPWRELGRAILPPLVLLVAAVLVQAKGWTYHWVPAEAATGFLFFATLASRTASSAAYVEVRKIPYERLAVLTVLSALLISGARVANADRLSRTENPYFFVLAPFVERLPPESSFYVFSTTVRVSFPLATLYDAEWASRFNSLWLLPGVVRDSAPPAVAPAHRYLFDAVVEDLSRGRPDLLIVDTALPPGASPGFDYIEFFSSDRRFEELMTDYQKVGDAGRFALFKRTPGAAYQGRTPGGS